MSQIIFFGYVWTHSILYSTDTCICFFIWPPSHLSPGVDRDESKLVDYKVLEAAGGLEMLSSLATLSGEGILGVISGHILISMWFYFQ